MRTPTLVLRGLAYRWRTALAVSLGVAVATAVLVGALGAGDTVRASLRVAALARLGRTELALEGGERFFRAELAGELAAELGGSAAALIALPGSVSARGGDVRASPVQVLGVEEAFWSLASEAPPVLPDADGVLLGEPLARRLGVGSGEEVVLRVAAGSSMPGEAPLATGFDATTALRLTVTAVLGEGALGRFGLRANQAFALNAFVSRPLLAGRIGRAGRANTLLLASGRPLAHAEQALQRRFRLEDAGLSLARVGTGWELASDRVFIEPAVEEAALAAGGRGVLAYFVDRISHAGRSIAYSFASSALPSRLPVELAEDECVLNAWASRELEAKAGDTVELDYRVPAAAPGGPLEERTVTLRVWGVVPIQPADRTLMPAFPGFVGVANCRDWDPGVPLDLSRIGARDQSYWDEYGGSPRVFLALPTAQRLWGNRFGRLTAVRFDGAPGGAPPVSELSSRLSPRSFGLALTDVRAAGLAAAASGVDFGQLFLGLSLFLVAGALLLTALLALLSVDQRAGDIAALAALGFTRRWILLTIAAEGAVVSLAGSSLGVALGIACHRGILAGLATAWHDAVRTPVIVPSLAAASMALGGAGGLVASLAVIVLATTVGLRRRRRESARRRRVLVPAIVASAGLGGAAIAGLLLEPPTGFFAAGALLLAGLLACGWLGLGAFGRPRETGRPSLAGAGAANAFRRANRSMAVASVLACGIFIVTAVSANRPAEADPDRRDSGTGGFALVAETSVALTAERERRLASTDLAGSPFVALRVLEGDDASCLNANRVERPRILGVVPSSLAGRFAFTEAAEGVSGRDPWSVLDWDLGPDTIPAVADRSVITWGLGRTVGDELTYLNEAGRTLKVRLVAGIADSIFQGSLLVSESALVRHFPSSSGHRVLLIEAEAGGRAEVESALGRSLAAFGVVVEPAADRLARFDSVEGTYLAIFGLLGWLGMLIGTIGLAVVVARNAAETRPELALLRAVGFDRRALLGMVLAEHLPPLAFGLAAGIVASLVAVSPAARLARASPDAVQLMVPVASIAACALLCLVGSAVVSLRADLLPTLREE